jgi:hypothetical protein
VGHLEEALVGGATGAAQRTRALVGAVDEEVEAVGPPAAVVEKAAR